MKLVYYSIIKVLMYFWNVAPLFEVKNTTFLQKWSWPIVTIKCFLLGLLSEVHYTSIGYSLTASTWQSHHSSSITLCPLPVIPLQLLSGILMENDMLVGSSAIAALQWPPTCHNEIKGGLGQEEVLVFPLRILLGCSLRRISGNEWFHDLGYFSSFPL